MPSIVVAGFAGYHADMNSFKDTGSTCLAQMAWLVLAVLVLGGATVCTAQSDSSASERTAGQDEEQNEYLASRGFYQRQASGHGWFLTRSDPEMKRSRTLSDVLRTVPGVNATAIIGTSPVTSARDGGACPIAVFVDGSYTTIRNVDELSLDDIEALEVYRGPSEVPLAYTAPTYEGTCGALLIWSRMEISDD